MAGRKSRNSKAKTSNTGASTPEAKLARYLPELVVGLVGPVKTDLKFVGNEIEELLRQVGYGDIQRIRISDLITEIEREIPLHGLDDVKITLEAGSEDRRLLTYMEAGNAIRRMTGDPSILAAYAVGRLRHGRDPQKPRASIIHSLKTPEETQLLRRIYGVGFFLIGASSPRSVRENSLATAIASERGVGQSSKKFAECQETARQLIEKDENEPESSGQKLRDTFHLSDFFVSIDDESKTSRDAASAELRRFVELVMGNLGHTPTRDEYLMFQAYAASMRSGALARQVGAVVATEKGEVLGLGCNDVPRAGGGLYWPGDPDDARDLTRERDSSNELSEQMLGELLDRLKGHELLAAVPDMADVRHALRGTRVLSLLEFGRTTHAEMEALLSAARIGASIQDCALYTTTFPCHECARLILTAGVKRVVYVEPYPKSLAAQLHSDGLSMGPHENSEAGLPKVEFLPFAGVGPRRYMDLFSMMTSVGKSLDRKTSDGFRIKWSPETAEPRLPLLPASYIELEGKTLLEIEERFRSLKVNSRDNSPREKRNGRR